MKDGTTIGRSVQTGSYGYFLAGAAAALAALDDDDDVLAAPAAAVAGLAAQAAHTASLQLLQA